MAFAAVMTAATVQMAQAAETLLYLNYDNVERSVKEGPDLFPYVCDGKHTAARATPNAGFLRVPKGQEEWNALDATPAAAITQAGEELTIEFFVKGNPESFAAWQYAVTIGGPWDWSVRVDANAQRNIRLCVNQSDSFGKESSVSLVDGKWHHIAVTVKPREGGGSHVETFVDYSPLWSGDLTSGFKYGRGGVFSANRDGGGGYCGGCDVDEVRFTRGILDKSEFLRLEENPPVDGETLLYLPFDVDGKTIAHAEWQGQVSGTPRLVEATRTHTAVKEWGTGVKVRNENVKFLEMTGELYVYNSCWALQRPNCDTCTIEFFIKGNPSAPAWSIPLCYGNWTSPGGYGFLVQVRDDKKIWLKPGVGNSDVGIFVPADLSKEKWHHVAVQISPSTKAGCENGSRFDVYLDYGETPVASADYANAFNGLAQGRLVINPGSVSYCAIDELRVTKGILPVSKFLAFGKLGLFLVIK